MRGKPHKLVRRSQIDENSHALISDGGETAMAVKIYNHKTKAMGSNMESFDMTKHLGKSPKVS